MSSHGASQDIVDNRIRHVDIATGNTTTLAGSGTRGFLDGDGGSVEFTAPVYVAIDPSGIFALVTVRQPPPHLAVPRTAHPPRTRRRDRTGFHHTLCGHRPGSSLALPQCVLP